MAENYERNGAELERARTNGHNESDELDVVNLESMNVASSSSSSSNEPSANSATDSSQQSSASTFVRTTQVKTLVGYLGGMQDDGRDGVRGDRERTSPPSSPSESSTFKRYKFGLTNHFLAMPNAGNQADAKFYRAKLKAADNKERRSRREQKHEQKNTEEVGKERDRDAAAEDEDHDCDLSVMGPSSTLASSLSSQEEEEWPRNNAAGLSAAAKPQPHTKHLHKLGGGAGHQATMAPAGDAGLDAKKCNSKAQSSYLANVGINDSYLQPISPAISYLNHPAGSASTKLNGNLLDNLTSVSHDGNLELHNHQHKHYTDCVKNHAPASELERECSSTGLLVRISSVMYATFLVILGCILHVSELRQKSKNSSDHIYTTVVALIGILWLVFLQIDLQRYKKYASKYILLESIFNNHQHANSKSNLSASSNLMLDPTARSTTSSSASLVNDRMSMNTEVIFKKTAYQMHQRRAAAAMNQQPKAKSQNHRHQHHSRQYKRDDANSLAGQSVYSLEAASNSSPTSSAGLTHSGSSLIPAYKFLHGKMGANFYLKCGMAAFCFGHVIHEGLRFGQQVYFFATSNEHCRDSAALVAHLVTPLYSFYQLFMMFKYSNLVINRHKVLARFGLMHIIGTCVTFWFRTILEEAFEDFVHKMDYFKAQNKPINAYLDPTASSFRDNNRRLQNSNTLSLATANSPAASWFNAVSALTTLSTSSSESSPSRFQSAATQINAMNFSDAELTNGGGGQNVSRLVHSALLALMSSPLSATITPQLVRHIPESYHCAQNTLLTTKSMNALPYLYPFTIEYNLLIAATFLSLYFNIGKIGAWSAAGRARASACYTNCCKSPAGLHGRAPQVHKGHTISEQPSSYYADNFSDNNSSAAFLRRFPSHERHHNASSLMAKPASGELGEYKSNFVVNADCHAANKGLFLGFFVLLVTLVTIIIFFVTINKPSHLQLGITINLIQEATLTSLILIVTLAGYRQIMRLNRNPFIRDKVTTDDVLMLIPLPFFFIHSLLAFRAETATLYAPSHLTKSVLFLSPLTTPSNQQQQHDTLLKLNASLATGGPRSQQQRWNLLQLATSSAEQLALQPRSQRDTNQTSSTSFLPPPSSSGQGTQAPLLSSKVDHYKLLTIALNLAVMIEVLVQTNFIIDGLRRCSESRYLRFKKPGRELITFAIILNITYWIVATFETKSVEQYKTEIEYYGPLPYMFISHTTLPVMLFYRYHSSVCLAEIWNRAYKSPKER